MKSGRWQRSTPIRRRRLVLFAVHHQSGEEWQAGNGWATSVWVRVWWLRSKGREESLFVGCPGARLGRKTVVVLTALRVRDCRGEIRERRSVYLLVVVMRGELLFWWLWCGCESGEVKKGTECHRNLLRLRVLALFSGQWRRVQHVFKLRRSLVVFCDCHSNTKYVGLGRQNPPRKGARFPGIILIEFEWGYLIQ